MRLKKFARLSDTQKAVVAAYVPAGCYLIGSACPDKSPAAYIQLRAFWIGRDAVTNEQFGWFMRAGGYSNETLWTAEGLNFLREYGVAEPAFWRDSRFNLPRQPATGISFYEAEAFAHWLGGRLPTEAEWEAAGRGPSARTYPWGDELPNLRLASFAPGFVPAQRAPSEVGRFRKNVSPFGCRQLAGNVFEWCSDFFQFDTPRQRAVGQIVERRPSGRRVLKGGAWTTDADRIRLSARWSYTPELRDNILGFRVVFDDFAEQNSAGNELASRSE